MSCSFCDRDVGNGSGALLLCFELTCQAPSTQLDKGVIAASGCEVGGVLGTACRFGCSTGYDESDVSDGICSARWLAEEQVAVAEYAGQTVTCTPARNADGTLSESFCRMQLAEVVLDCCEMATGGAALVSSTPCSRAASLVASASGNSSGMNGGCSAGGSGSRYGILSAAVLE